MDSKQKQSLVWFLLGGGIATSLLSAGWLAHAAIDPARTWGTIPYRGHLEVGGQPVDGTVDLLLALWNAETGGTKLWEERHDAVRVSSGAFTVRLGSVTTLSPEVERAADLYLDVAVKRAEETAFQPLTSRQALAAVPFALSAKQGIPGQEFLADRVNVAQSLNVTGSATLAGPATVGDRLTVGSGLEVTGTISANGAPLREPQVICGTFPSGTLSCPPGKKVLFGVAGRPFIFQHTCPPVSLNNDWYFGTGNEFPMGDDASGTCNDVQTLILGCTGASSCTFDAMPCAGGGNFVAEIICI